MMIKAARMMALASLSVLALSACSQSKKADMQAANDLEVQADAALGNELAQDVPVLGGASMMPNRTMIQNLSDARNMTVLVSALGAAGLSDSLSGAGPFTLFAPTNDAFDKLPRGTVDELMKPENIARLKDMLSYHLVPGALTVTELNRMIEAGGGTAELNTVSGKKLSVSKTDEGIVLTDGERHKVTVIQSDIAMANGTVHVVDTVMMPT